jgi:hypothetical protein
MEKCSFTMSNSTTSNKHIQTWHNAQEMLFSVHILEAWTLQRLITCLTLLAPTAKSARLPSSNLQIEIYWAGSAVAVTSFALV